MTFDEWAEGRTVQITIAQGGVETHYRDCGALSAALEGYAASAWNAGVVQGIREPEADKVAVPIDQDVAAVLRSMVNTIESRGAEAAGWVRDKEAVLLLATMLEGPLHKRKAVCIGCGRTKSRLHSEGHASGCKFDQDAKPVACICPNPEFPCPLHDCLVCDHPLPCPKHSK